MFLQLPFESLEKRNSICASPRKSSDHLVIVKPTRFAGRVLHYVIAHGHLAIGDQHCFIVLAHAQHGCTVRPGASLPSTHPHIIQCRASAKPREARGDSMKGFVLRQSHRVWRYNPEGGGRGFSWAGLTVSA